MAKIILSSFIDEASKDIDTQIEVLKNNNIKFIELRSIDGINVKDFTIEQARQFYKKYNDNGISVYSIGSPLGKVDINVDFEEYKNVIRHVCEIALIFKCNKIRMFSFFNAYNHKDIVVNYLNRMVEIAKEYNVELYHENEKDIFGDKIERIEYIFDNVKNLKMIYDPANFIQVGEDVLLTIDKFVNKADYFHVKDCVIKTGEIVPSGCGDACFDKIVSLINKDIIFSLEPHLSVFEGYNNIDKTELKNKYCYSSNIEAFQESVKALKKCLLRNGYIEAGDGFIKE